MRRLPFRWRKRIKGTAGALLVALLLAPILWAYSFDWLAEWHLRWGIPIETTQVEAERWMKRQGYEAKYLDGRTVDLTATFARNQTASTELRHYDGPVLVGCKRDVMFTRWSNVSLLVYVVFDKNGRAKYRYAEASSMAF